MDYQPIINELSNRGLTAEMITVNKNGRDLNGVRIDTGTLVQPVLYPQYYGDVENMSIDEIVDRMVDEYNDALGHMPTTDTKLFTDPAYIMCHCYIGLCSKKNLSDDIISRPSSMGIPDTYEYMYYIIPSVDPRHRMRIVIAANMLGIIPMTVDELWLHSYENTMDDIKLIDMNDYVSRLTGIPAKAIPDFGMVILTNSDHWYGASAILNTTMLRDYANARGVNRIVCFPASVHEWILVPGDDDIPDDSQGFIDTIANGNQYVNDTEILGDKPFVLNFD